MKRTLLVANWMLAAALLAAAEKTPESMLGAALHQEEVQGDLKGAIAAYQKVVVMPGVSRKTAAEALVRMGQCYEKLGDVESRKAYERVVRDYADQKDAVTLARAHLGKRPASHGPAFRQVWKVPYNADIFGKASGDGRYMPYVAWEQHGNLLLHDFATGLDRQLTNTATLGIPGKTGEFAQRYVFSPDGEQLVYSWCHQGRQGRFDLRLIDLKGGGIPQPRPLFHNPELDWIAPGDWSPDGKWIAVLIRLKDRTTQIGLVSVADGQLRVLKSADWRGATKLFFSPDSRYLGYDLPENDVSEQRDVFVLTVDGNREIPAVVHRGQDTMMGWAPDGKRLLFASDRTGSMDLWAIGFADGKFQGEPALIKSDIGVAESIVITRSGALYLAISTGADVRSNIQVASFDFATGKLISPPVDVAQESFAHNTNPRWSQDGKYLAYLSVRGRAEVDKTIVIRSAETNQVVRELPVNMLYPLEGWNWAPDGGSLLLQGFDFKGQHGIYQLDIQRGNLTTLLLHELKGQYPVYSPDRKSLYFRRQLATGDEFALVQRDLVSGHERELIRRAFLVPDQISPDGRYFAISTVDVASGSRVKLLVPTDSGETRELMRVSAGVDPGDLMNYRKGTAVLGAQWAPDSRSFLTLKRFNDKRSNGEVWRVQLNGGAPTKLDLQIHDQQWEFAQVHPDGRRIAFTVSETGWPKSREVWVLENFLPPITAASK